MKNKQMKCIKGESCLYCGSNYCRFVVELDQLKEEIEKEKALKQTYLACYKTKHRDVKGELFKYEKFRQALQETREIVQNKLSLVCKDCVLKQCKTCEAKQILQKCEVKDE